MSDLVNKLLHSLESAHIGLLAKPTFDMPKAMLEKHLAELHEVSLKILTLETSNLAVINRAATIEHDKLLKAIELLDYAKETDPRYLQLLQSVDSGMHILSNFFKLLM